MSDPETIQNVKSQNEEFERKYSQTFGEDHPDGKKLMHDILAKRLQTIGGKQFFDSGDYNRDKCKGLRVPMINTEQVYISQDKHVPPNPRLSPKGRRLSSSSCGSMTGSTGIGSACCGDSTCSPPKDATAIAPAAIHPAPVNPLPATLHMHPHHTFYQQGSQSPTHFQGWHHIPHGSQSSSSSHYSGSPLSHFHMSPLHVNTELGQLTKPIRRLSSTSSCGEPSPLATEGMIQVAFKRPPIPGLDCEAYHGDAIQISLHSPHSPCTLSNRGRSPSSTHFCLSDSNSCRNSPININCSQEEELHEDVVGSANEKACESTAIKVPSQCKKPKSSFEKDQNELSLARTATLTDDCCEETNDDPECTGNCDNMKDII